jgi:uncharacterized protein (TIGR03437 family)
VKVLKLLFTHLTLAVGCLSALHLASGAALAQNAVTLTNGAYYQQTTITANSIATAFGTFTTTGGQSYVAPSVPLPKVLGGVSLTINGVAADLLYVGPTQINLIVPGTIQQGAATVIVTNSDGTTKSGTFTVAAAAPGIFTSNFTGLGAAAGEATVDGVTYVRTGNLDGTTRDIVLESGANARPTYVVLYGTGIRNTPAANPNDANGVAEAIKLTVQGVPAQVAYAGAQGAGAPGSFAGLDQINFIIPQELAGLGELTVQVTIPGQTQANANPVKIKLAGQLPPVRTQTMTPGVTYSGALTVDDQVEMDTTTGKTYFFDAFRFTATAGQSVAIDLRSAQFDAAIIVRRIDGTTLSFFAGDDQGGTFGDGNVEVNNNAMLLTVFPDNADYVIYVTSSDLAPNATGSYTVKLTTGNITPVTYPSTTNGSITNTDLQTEAGVYLDAYSFNYVAGDNVQINLSSTAFDAFLSLRNNQGDELKLKDDGGAGMDAQFSIGPSSADPTLRNLPSGKYIIVATPLAANKFGNYTLTLTKLAGFAGEASAVEAVPSARPGREATVEGTRRNWPSINLSRRRAVTQE